MIIRQILLFVTSLLTGFPLLSFAQSSDSNLMVPQKVATPPKEACIGLPLMEDGEIRHYNNLLPSPCIQKK